MVTKRKGSPTYDDSYGRAAKRPETDTTRAASQSSDEPLNTGSQLSDDAVVYGTTPAPANAAQIHAARHLNNASITGLGGSDFQARLNAALGYRHRRRQKPTREETITDNTLLPIQRDWGRWTREMNNAILNLVDVADRPNSKEVRMFSPGNYDAGEIEATSVLILATLIRRCRVGFFLPDRLNHLLPRASQEKEADVKGTCHERLHNILRILRHQKTVCRDVLNERTKVEQFVNAPLHYAKGKESSVKNNKRRAKHAEEIKAENEALKAKVELYESDHATPAPSPLPVPKPFPQHGLPQTFPAPQQQSYAPVSPYVPPQAAMMQTFHPGESTYKQTMPKANISTMGAKKKRKSNSTPKSTFQNPYKGPQSTTTPMNQCLAKPTPVSSFHAAMSPQDSASHSLLSPATSFPTTMPRQGSIGSPIPTVRYPFAPNSTRLYLTNSEDNKPAISHQQNQNPHTIPASSPPTIHPAQPRDKLPTASPDMLPLTAEEAKILGFDFVPGVTDKPPTTSFESILDSPLTTGYQDTTHDADEPNLDDSGFHEPPQPGGSEKITPSQQPASEDNILHLEDYSSLLPPDFEKTFGKLEDFGSLDPGLDGDDPLGLFGPVESSVDDLLYVDTIAPATETTSIENLDMDVAATATNSSPQEELGDIGDEERDFSELFGGYEEPL